MEEKNVQEIIEVEDASKIKAELEEAKKIIANLYQQQQQMSIANLLKRLDILFTVVQNADRFSEVFVSNCIKEIEAMVTLESPQTPEGPSKEEE